MDSPTIAADRRSESNIATLLPAVQPLARRFILEANGALTELAPGVSAVITSARRTDDEQDALYEQGRSRPGAIVTNARAGYSNHNFGMAFDVTLFDHGRPLWESPLYREIAGIGKRGGLLWGGDWHPADESHYEFRPDWAREMTENQALAEYRERAAKGKALV